MNKASLLSHLGLGLALFASSVGLIQPAMADYPQTRTTVHLLGSQMVDSTHYRVHAVVYAHGASVGKVEFAVSGRWATVGAFEGKRSDGGLVFGATVFGHPTNSLQA